MVAPSDARASLSNPSRPFTPATMTGPKRKSRIRVSEGKDAVRREDEECEDAQVESELRDAAKKLADLSTDVSRLEVLKPWINLELRKSRARSEVASALREGLARTREANARVAVARESLRFVDDDDALELAATQAIFEASVEETEEEERLVPVLVSRLAKAAQAKAPPLAMEPLVYITATLENYLGGRRRFEIVRASQGLLTCALCDLLRAAASWRQNELLFHATGALRNVCGDPSQTRQLQSGKAVNLVARALHIALEKRNVDWDLVLNASRCLAILSTNDSKGAWLDDAGRLDDPESLLADVLDALTAAYSQRRRAVVVRLAYALGNATADSSQSRHVVGRRIDRIVAMLEDASRREDEEILTKFVRLVANCSIDPIVGARAAASPQVACLSRLLVDTVDNEELLLNVVSAIANLSYYSDTSVCFDAETCSRLVDVLLHQNHEAVSEAARAFGNMSRDSTLRRLMSKVQADEALMVLLEHADRDVVFAAVGALVNLAPDPLSHERLKDAPPHLVDIVRRAGIQDLPLASVACKALHNWLLAKTTTTATKAHPEEKEKFLVPGDIVRLRRTLDELVDVAEHAVARFDEEERQRNRTFLAAANALLPLLIN